MSKLLALKRLQNWRGGKSYNGLNQNCIALLSSNLNIGLIKLMGHRKATL